jgi:hypothetical protein
MAKDTASITMLRTSPTYIANVQKTRPQEKIKKWLKTWVFDSSALENWHFFISTACLAKNLNCCVGRSAA